jgi:hypothetical protein
MTYRAISSLCLLLASALAVSSARADVAVMVPPRTDQMPATDVSETASEELSRLLRLQGFSVISPGQAGAAAEGQQKSGAFSRNYDPLFCITPECANEYRKLFDALFAVQMAIQSKAGRPVNVTVVLTEEPKAFFSASALIEGGDVRAAVRHAYEEAREKQRDGAGPWLSVSGVPEGATIYIDNVEFGHLPIKRRRISAGSHQLEARQEAYVSESRSLNIASNIEHEETVVIALKPIETLAATTSSRRSRRIRRSPWDWAIGGVVTAVGAAHLIAGVYQKAKEGDCAEHQNGACTEVYGTGSGVKRDNLLLGLGAAGVAVGGLIMGLGPIGSLGLRADREHAMLELKGKF